MLVRKHLWLLAQGQDVWGKASKAKEDGTARVKIMGKGGITFGRWFRGSGLLG